MFLFCFYWLTQERIKPPLLSNYDRNFYEVRIIKTTGFALIYSVFADLELLSGIHLTIIPRARMGSESIAHEGERNNCF